VVSGQDSFKCMSQVVVGVIPGDRAPNPGPGDRPIYETCPKTYSLSEEAAYVEALKRRAQQQQSEADDWHAKMAESRAQWERQVDDWLAAIDDPTERDLQRARLNRRPAEITGLVEWFLSRAAAKGVLPVRIPRYRTTVFGNPKLYYDSGWMFSGGSTSESADGATLSIALNTAGIWLLAPNFDPGGSYTSVVLDQMAEILELGDPPAHNIPLAPSLSAMMQRRSTPV
jgi:hypothetical protein